MAKEYRLLPTSILEMVDCIKSLTDAYRAAELTDRQFTELINRLIADNKRFFWDTPGNVNCTIQRKCGKKRLTLIKAVLNDAQLSLDEF